MNVFKRRPGCRLAAACGLGLALSGVLPADPPKETKLPADKDKFLDRTVELPRYIVSVTRVDKRPWRYAAVPGFEVLSRAPDDDTARLLEALQRGLWLENKLLPEDWRPAAPVPYTVIVDNTNLRTLQTTAVQVEPMEFSSPADAFAWGLPAAAVNVWKDQYEARDADTFALNVNVYEANLGYASVSLERLERCAPALPPWLAVGLVGRNVGLLREGFMLLHRPDPYAPYLTVGAGPVQKMVAPGTLWISIEETQRLQKEFEREKKLRARGRQVEEARLPFLPLDRLFARAPVAAPDQLLWQSEAALFVRWGLLETREKDPAMAAAFRRFVQRARREPVDERMFTECFGCGYAAMEKTLKDFLQEVIARPVSLDPEFPSEFPQPELKPATADQIGRILGDWLRLQGRSVREQDPAMSGWLLAASGRMLTRAYRMDNGLPPDADPAPPAGPAAARPAPAAGEPVVALPPFVVTVERIHDPELLAIFGLYEHDAGHDARAREFLEKAVADGTVRPRARVVLAQLRYAEAVARLAGTGARLSRGQADFILAPVQALAPAAMTLESYGLMVETWARCETGPADPDVATMVEGAARYPAHPLLVFRTAGLCAQNGRLATARDLIAQGLVFVTDANTRTRFEELRARLEKAASAP